MNNSIKALTRTFLVVYFFICSFSCVAAKEIEVFHLKNGHTVIVKEIHANPIVTIDTWVKTGSVNENDHNNGVAHFLEHLFFKGTDHHPQGSLEQIIESHGGVFNAATSKDFTHFYITIASEYFDTALDLHSDMLLHPAIPLPELNRERKVVQEEIRRSMDSPSRELFNNLNAMLFKFHPYKYKTLGTEEIIENITREEIFDFYNKWYVPSNMVTVVVGDVDTDKVLAKVQEKFAYNPAHKFKTPKHKKEPYLKHSEEKVSKGKFNTGYMIIGFKGTDIKNKKDSYALDIAASILGDGKTSRLYQQIKEKKQLVNSVDAGHYSLKDDSIFYVSATFDPKNYEELEKALVDEIHKIVNQGITPEELQRAKNIAQRQFIYENESVSSVANSIGYTMVVAGDIDYYTKYVNDLNKIREKDVVNALKKYVMDSRMAVSVVLPKSTEVKKEQEANAQVDKNIKPVAHVQDKYENVTKYKLDNGIDLITEENDANEIVSLSVFVKGGVFVESTPGVADIVEETLLQGTTNRTALEISQELENSGIIIRPTCGNDKFVITMKSTKADFNKAFDILKDIIENPSFETPYIEKAKKNILQNIKQSRDLPVSVALEEFGHAIYKGHPYSNNGKVLEKTLPQISRSEVLTYYNSIFSPENMVIAVSGNYDKNDVVRKFESIKKRPGVKVVDLNEFKTKFKYLNKDKIVVVKKDTATAWMIMGWPAEGITSKDYATLKVIGNILGGGMSSRLFQNLREKQSLAYEISSAYPSNYDTSFFMVYIGTKPSNLAKAKIQFEKEIDRIKNEKVSDKELKAVKEKIVGRYALSQETNGQKSNKLGWYETISKGYKYTYELPEEIKKVTREDIFRVANKYLGMPYLISVVGPKKYVEVVEKGFQQSENKR